MHMNTISALPTSASAMPPSWPKSGRGSVKKLKSSWLRPLYEHRPQHEREHPDREHRGPDGCAAERLLDQPAPPQAVRGDRDVVFLARLVDRGRGRGHRALRVRSNLFTISWAATLVTSEITIRIAAR